MTSFIPLSIGERPQDRLYVNAALITRMWSDSSGQTVIHFDKDNSVITKTPLEDIVSAIETTAPA